jgi:hypothetical protein
MARTPSPILVAETYLKSVLDAAMYGVSTTLPTLTVLDQKNLPKDNWNGKQTWITPRAIGTVTQTFTVPRRSPFLTITAWSKEGGGKNRNWARAEDACQEILELATDWYSSLYLEIPHGYRPVNLVSFTAVSDVRRIEADPQGLARVEVDAILSYDLK